MCNCTGTAEQCRESEQRAGAERPMVATWHIAAHHRFEEIHLLFTFHLVIVVSAAVVVVVVAFPFIDYLNEIYFALA